MLHRIASLATFVVLLIPSSVFAVTIDEVVAWSAEGRSDTEIIAAIEADDSRFVLSPLEILELSKRGVQPDVLKAIIARRDSPEPEPSVIEEPAVEVELPPAPLDYYESADILKWLDAGEPDERILEAIAAAETVTANVSEIKMLRAAGVPQRILSALTQRSLQAKAAPKKNRKRSRVDRKTTLRGFQAILGIGANACAEGSECGGNSADVGFLISAGWRFASLFSLSLDIGYGSLDTERSVADSASALAVMPTARFHAALGRSEIYAGLGVGYASQTAKDTGFGGTTVKWSTPLAGKFVAGFGVGVSRTVRLGFGIEYYSHPARGEVCVNDDCGDISDFGAADVNDRITAMLTLAIGP